MSFFNSGDWWSVMSPSTVPLPSSWAVYSPPHLVHRHQIAFADALLA